MPEAIACYAWSNREGKSYSSTLLQAADKMIKAIPENSEPISTVLLSRPGIMQQSLRTLRSGSYPWVSLVASAGDGLTALSEVSRHKPRLVVINSNLLDEEVAALLTDGIKRVHPPARCLVLVRIGSRHDAQMRTCGADAVALRDGSPPALEAVLLRFANEASEPLT